jgi:hypothetical protein
MPKAASLLVFTASVLTGAALSSATATAATTTKLAECPSFVFAKWAPFTNGLSAVRSANRYKTEGGLLVNCSTLGKTHNGRARELTYAAFCGTATQVAQWWQDQLRFGKRLERVDGTGLAALFELQFLPENLMMLVRGSRLVLWVSGSTWKSTAREGFLYQGSQRALGRSEVRAFALAALRSVNSSTKPCGA